MARRIMMATDFAGDIQGYLEQFKNALDSIDTSQINRIANILLGAYINEKQVFVFGNGGSASTASHLVCDFNKGACSGLEKKFKIICLNDNIPMMLALANDLGYETIFVEQLKNYIREGDIVIGISGSGNSKNVLKAIEYAKGMNARTVGICGFDGGALKKIAETTLVVGVNDMQKAEDAHMVVMHLLMQAMGKHLKHNLGGATKQKDCAQP